MKAIVHDEYGSPDVLGVREIEKPSPRGKEILIRIRAASVNAGDLHLLRAEPALVRLASGLLKPKHGILGADIAGIVESAGSGATLFKAGDAVFGDLSAHGRGGFAEYVCAPEDAVILKPAGLGFDEAAAVPTAAVTALQGLRDKGSVRAGMKVLVYGASGGVGTFAVQIAKALGAEVTAVCSGGKADLLRSLGADKVIDYSREDFSRNGEQYDLVLAANGDRPISEYRRALGPKGTYVLSGGSMRQYSQAMFLGPWLSTGGRKMGTVLARPSTADLAFIKGLIEAGKIAPVIDRRYPLSQTADACRYLEAGHAKGKIVITME